MHVDALAAAHPLLAYPEAEPSTDLAENSMRSITLGHRNGLHLGSERAGPKVATLPSMVETCRRRKLPVRDHLGAVLPGLANFPIRRIAELPRGYGSAISGRNQCRT